MPEEAKPDDPAQSQRFIEMAKEVETTENPNKLEKIFKKIVKISASPKKAS